MNIRSLFILLGVILIVTSCNKIEFPNKDTVDLVDVSDTIFPDTNTNTIRHVLVEEFTGQNCAPCPGGAKTLRDLQAMYETSGKHLVAVAIHEGALCYPHVSPDTSFLYEYRVATGSYLANSLFNPDNLPGTPSALVNRVPYPTVVDRWVYQSDWQSAADLEFAKPNVMNLDMVVEFDTVAKTGTIAVRSWYLDDLTGDQYLMVYLTQDSIVNWQKNGPLGFGDDAYPLSTDVENYVHRHAFRGCLSNPPTGAGILVSSGTTVAGTKVIKAFNFNLADMVAVEEVLPGPRHPFVAKHLSFVAFVYDYTTKEVLQVIEHHAE
jgi:hypothetical protein